MKIDIDVPSVVFLLVIALLIAGVVAANVFAWQSDNLGAKVGVTTSTGVIITFILSFFLFMYLIFGNPFRRHF
jgi:hypothetical protein